MQIDHPAGAAAVYSVSPTFRSPALITGRPPHLAGTLNCARDGGMLALNGGIAGVEYRLDFGDHVIVVRCFHPEQPVAASAALSGIAQSTK